MNKFLKYIGLVMVMSLGLTACGDNDERVVVVEKPVVAEPVVRPVWTPPATVMQSYTFADVERTYLQCLQTYGVHNDDMCEEYCAIYYNANSCDVVEDYYEDRYGIGRDGYEVNTSALFAAGAVGYFMGSSSNKAVIVNNHYGKPVRTISPKYSSVKPVRVVKGGKVVSSKSVQAGKVGTVKSGVTKVSATKDQPKAVQKIGTGNVTKTSNQFTAKKPGSDTKSSQDNTAATVATAGAAVATGTVVKVGTGDSKKTANQFSVKKPQQTVTPNASDKKATPPAATSRQVTQPKVVKKPQPHVTRSSFNTSRTVVKKVKPKKKTTSRKKKKR